ncbi:MAG: PfkB family carbohydrate kinase [Methylobacillus sp.]|jgi:ketohexokinase|nr:PfkB family carbohydrate kinase [Methylobacillus sp.]
MARILLVGTATLDLVFELDHSPDADEEMRAQSLRICRGGNAANTAVVLSQLGHEVEFFGTLADAAETSVITHDFHVHGVAYAACPRLAGRPPTSSIYLSGANRSIVHYRDLPELTLEHFQIIDPAVWDIVHFECRNVAVIAQAIQQFRERAPATRISLEIEKPREGMEVLYSLADMLIYSRNFALHSRFTEPVAFLDWMRSRAPRAVLTLGWGEAGAYGCAPDGAIKHVPAVPPETVVDTLGAGDTFNAGLLDALVRGDSPEAALWRGVALAGKKCAIHGFDLGELLQKNDSFVI